MTEQLPPPTDTPPCPSFDRLGRIADVLELHAHEFTRALMNVEASEYQAMADSLMAHRATLAAAQATAQRLAKFEDDELHKSVVRDLPGHPVYAPCALEGCQYDDVATVAQGTARHLSELEDIRRCLHLCPTHELTPMGEDGKSTCLICEYLHAEAAYAALREHNSKLMDELMALEQKWCTDAKEEARRLYSEKTTDWLAIRTLEGRTKEDCAAALRAVLQGTK